MRAVIVRFTSKSAFHRVKMALGRTPQTWWSISKPWWHWFDVDEAEYAQIAGLRGVAGRARVDRKTLLETWSG